MLDLDILSMSALTGYNVNCSQVTSRCLFFFLRFYLFLDGGKGGVKEKERQGEKRQCVVASQVPHTGNLAHNADMYPDWEWNQ